MLRRILGRETAAVSPTSDDLTARTTSPADNAIIERALPFTMTGRARLQALIDAVRYCVDRGVEGDLVECGVWRGGSVMAMLLTLQDMGVSDRDVHLYDTFEGMTAPCESDVSPVDPPARESWDAAAAARVRPWGELFDPSLFNEAAVRDTVLGTGYPEQRVHLVKGPVERTLLERVPDRVALLRLDTDWYESTRVEMQQLYPRVVEGGVLIVDDYGHWEGARRAVDEHLTADGRPLLLTRIDYTARIAVKH